MDESHDPGVIPLKSSRTFLIGFGIDEIFIKQAVEHGSDQVDILLVRDRLGDGYLGGIADLGSTVEESVSKLATRSDELSTSRLITMGQGIGGYAAMIYGVLLGASRIVAIEPYAHLIGETLEKYNDRRWRRELSRLPDQEVARRFEVTNLIEQEQYRGEVHVLLGTRPLHERGDPVHLDAIHAHWLGRSKRITLHPLTQCAPGFLGELEQQQRLGPFLSHYLFDEKIEASSSDRSSLPLERDRTQYPHPIQYNSKLTICRINQSDPTNASSTALAYAAAGDVDVGMTRKINDGLRRWIAENLFLGASPDDLAKNLESKGIARKETLQEVELARCSPYFFASTRLLNRINKRDWLVTTYRKLNRLRRKSIKIERRDKLTPDQFLKQYYSTGRPLIMERMMEGSGALDFQKPGEITRKSAWLEELESSADRESLLAISLDENRAGSSEMFDHEWEIVNRSNATLIQGDKESVFPELDNRANLLIADFLGRVRVRLIPWWDMLLLDEAKRVSRSPEEYLSPASHLTPLDRPEILEFTLNPGELLFIPAGSETQFEYLESALMVSFDRLTFDRKN